MAIVEQSETERSLRLAVIVINYQTPRLTIDCLSSLQDEIESGRDLVIVVDNASADSSVQDIRQAVQRNGWGQWVHLLQAPAHDGFSSGNNLALKTITADVYLLLNNDTLVRPGAISTLLHTLETHPEAGIVSPRLEWPDGTPQVSCFRNLTPVGEFLRAANTGPLTKLLRRYESPIFEFERAIEPQWTSFACVLIRRQVVEQIGLLDEGYFIFFEDVDYCRLVKQAGWRILYWPQARVVHLRGGTSPMQNAMDNLQRLPRYYYASRSRYFAKFYGKLGLWLANLLWLGGRTISLARELVGNKEPHICQLAGRDNWTNWWTPIAPL